LSFSKKKVDRCMLPSQKRSSTFVAVNMAPLGNFLGTPLVGTNGMSYEERLQFLDMITLETRRVIGNLIEVLKISTGMEDVKKEQFFTMEKWCARDMNLNDLSLVLTWTVGNNMPFSNRVINMWNSLQLDVNACNTV
jgi:hypothetical protein